MYTSGAPSVPYEYSYRMHAYGYHLGTVPGLGFWVPYGQYPQYGSLDHVELTVSLT